MEYLCPRITAPVRVRRDRRHLIKCPSLATKALQMEPSSLNTRHLTNTSNKEPRLMSVSHQSSKTSTSKVCVWELPHRVRIHLPVRM